MFVRVARKSAAIDDVARPKDDDFSMHLLPRSRRRAPRWSNPSGSTSSNLLRTGNHVSWSPVKHASFNPDWLTRKLAALVPGFPNASICIALSGGLDSTVLLSALATHRRRRTKLRAVHVHHGLHANADKWTEHCVALAERLDVPLQTVRIKVARPRGTSLEAAAREARYEALANALAPGEFLLTAHHEDDQLETVLLQLMRGAGIAGLAAMPESTPFAPGTLVRPLLTRPRADLEAWGKANALTWVDDDTNANEEFDRNYLRHRVLPLIRARWPGASRAVSRSARHAAEAKRLLDALARADVERASNGAALSVQSLRTLSPDRRRNAVRYWIARAGHPLPDTSRLDEITTTLLAARDDANPSVTWNGTRIYRHANHLHIEADRAPAPSGRASSPSRGARTRAAREDEPASRARPTARTPQGGARTPTARTSAPPALTPSEEAGDAPLSATAAQNEELTWNWRASARISLGGASGELSLDPDPHGPIDVSRLAETLTIRNRKGGERIRPKQGGRTKTLKSLLQESKTPLADRANLPLIYASEKLIAIADKWLDASIQATQTTETRARLRWHRT